jgi:serine/threonine-protein kinase
VAPGDVVAEKYRIDRMIGFGGMGVVCEGMHLELGAKVAVKFVRPEYAHDERVVARFLSEARAAAQLRSEHTCRVMDCGRLATGSPYMVMEYLDGADLRRIVAAQGCLPVEDAVSFALQACSALAEAHARGIVHRDVKPENLFLMQGPDGGALIKVLDFGISKQLGAIQGTRGLTDSSDSMGSPHHMSPEQMIDPSAVDARTDIWSLGVLLYELLTANLPFKGDSVPQVCANVMTAAAPSPRELNPEIPEGLAAVVLRCMDKNPDARFPDVAALSLSLKDFGGSAASVTAARVGRILDRTRSTQPPPPAAMGSESGFNSVDSPAHRALANALGVDDAPLSIAGLRRRPWGIVVGVLVGLVSVMAAGVLWRKMRLSTGEPSAAVSSSYSAALASERSEGPTALSQSGAPKLAPPLPPTLAPSLAPSPALAPALAPASASPRLPAVVRDDGASAKPAAKKSVVPKPNLGSVRPKAVDTEVSDPLPASTSVYPELKAPELPTPGE